ncbi:hypothetical protein B0H11DRAFT_2300148 [Mycena galericulata]|nr:hypothetical protein B0H11DRAFT_2300148 [Mycena galericulata]
MPPTLPPEIEREIFEWTAISYPSAIPALLRVSLRVQLWVEPYLYRVVKVYPEPPYSVMENAILRPTPKSKPASFYREAVRHLYLCHRMYWSSEVLQVCTKTRSLEAVWSSPALVPILLQMNLRELGLSLEDLFGGREYPLFDSITHLDVFDIIIHDDAKISPYIASLPSLTHLCLKHRVPGILYGPFCRTVLDSMSSSISGTSWMPPPVVP